MQIAGEPGEAGGDFFVADSYVAFQHGLVEFAVEQSVVFLLVLRRVNHGGGVAREVVV